MLTRIAALIFAAFWQGNVIADDRKCEFEVEFNREYDEQVKGRVEPVLADFVKAKAAAYDLLRDLGWSENDPIQPVVDVMPFSDRLVFSKTRREMSEIAAFHRVESSRARDLVFVKDAVTLSDKFFYTSAPLEKATQHENRVGNILRSIRELLPTVEEEMIAYEPKTKCDLSESIKKKAVTEYSLLRRREQEIGAIPEYEYFEEKYGWPVNRDQLEPGDVERHENAVTNLERFFVEMIYTSTLYKIGVYNNLSQSAAESYRMDLVAQPGDTDYLGTTWAAWVEEGRYSEKDLELSSLVGEIERYFPTKAPEMLR